MPKEKTKPEPECACEAQIVAATEKIAQILFGMWTSIGKTNKILRATEAANEQRHKELMEVLGGGQTGVRTMVYVRKRREKIT